MEQRSRRQPGKQRTAPAERRDGTDASSDRWCLRELLAAGPGDEPPDRYFARLAEQLLGETALDIAGEPHHLREVEFYLHSDRHPDPYVHRAPLQLTSGRWYFHREGRGYRGGSFKGVDLSFGPPTAYGGALLRSLSCPDGTVINGSSLCVDYLIQRTGAGSVAALDAALGERSAFEPGRIQLRADRGWAAPAIWATARVGLSFQRLDRFPEMLDYFHRRYRFLDAPREIKKGKPQVVVAMHEAGLTASEISTHTGTPRSVVAGWLQAYEQGRADEAWQRTLEGSLGSEQLCAVLGALSRRAPDPVAPSTEQTTRAR